MDEIVKKQFTVIPDVLKQHIASSALDENIEEILKDHPLQNVQKDAFGLEVMLVLLQLESIESFTINIKQSMEIAMKRAEEISQKTKQLIFLPIQEYLIEKSTIEGGASDGVVSDGVAAKDTRKELRNDIPLVDISSKKEEPKPNHPLVAPVPSENIPKAEEKVLQKPEVGPDDSLDIFKKRLQQPVHTPVEKNQVSDTGRPVANANPSTKEDIEKDPYKESF